MADSIAGIGTGPLANIPNTPGANASMQDWANFEKAMMVYGAGAHGVTTAIETAGDVAMSAASKTPHE